VSFSLTGFLSPRNLQADLKKASAQVAQAKAELQKTVASAKSTKTQFAVKNNRSHLQHFSRADHHFFIAA
jgi:hypothetical protein